MLISMGACSFCGGGNNTPCFATYTDGYKCFSCGASKSGKAMDFSYMPKKQKDDSGLYIPEHTSNPREFSTDALRYLYKYYIYDDTILQYNICFLQSTGNLLYKIYEDDKLSQYVERGIEPKTLKHRGNKHPCILRTESTKHAGRICIVEDYLSAVRVAKHTDALCLFGLFLTNDIMWYIIKQYSDILVWLDGDKQGQDAASRLDNQLMSGINNYNSKYPFNPVSCRIHNILTELDPKCYSDEDIIGVIN